MSLTHVPIRGAIKNTEILYGTLRLNCKFGPCHDSVKGLEDVAEGHGNILLLVGLNREHFMVGLKAL